MRDLTQKFEEGMVRSESAVSLASLKSRGPKKLAATTGAGVKSVSISMEHHIPATDTRDDQGDSQPSQSVQPINDESGSTHHPNSSEHKVTDESAETSNSLIDTSTPSKKSGSTSDPSQPVRTGKILSLVHRSPLVTSDASSVCQGQTAERTSSIVPPSPQQPVGHMLYNVDKFIYTVEWAEGGLLKQREGNT